MTASTVYSQVHTGGLPPQTWWSYWGENAPSYSMVKKWNDEFKCAGIVWKTTPIGESQSTSTHKTIARIHDIIMADRHVMEHYIATKLGISQDRIHAVIHNELHMFKVSVHCVPKLLGPNLKETRLNMSRGKLVMFRQIPTVFFRDL